MTMSNNFTDTNNYASSLNLSQDVSAGRPNYIPLQPNTIQRKNILSTNPSSLPLLTKKRTSSNDAKQRKKQVKGDNNLSTLANIATSPIPIKQEIKGQSPLQPQNLVSTPSQPNQHPAGHRPVTSCTHCRQHKIKCNASERFPSPCQRCEKMGLNCEIDPQFRPRKGSQIQSLRNDVDELKLKIEYLQRSESLIAQALANQQANNSSFIRNPNDNPTNQMKFDQIPSPATPINPLHNLDHSPPTLTSAKTILKREPQLLMDRRSTSNTSSRENSITNSIPQLLNDSAPTNSDQKDLPPFLEMSVRANTPNGTPIQEDNHNSNNTHNSPHSTRSVQSSNNSITEFVLGDVSISLKKANELNDRFVRDYLPFFPLIASSTASDLYSQSQLLFWTICLTACLSDPDPTLYNQLASLIKQLAIETCWIRTPRSTHISQALLILCMWPLPNQKVLDDCSYRFVGLAKSLGYQLGLHRGKFISEFSRTQVALPDAEKWRTRTWLGIFFAEQFWASQLGLPPSLQTDYLIESARVDENLPKNFRSLISLSIFQAKLVNVMGSSVISPDGLMEARNRAGSLAILERELERLVFKLKIDDIIVEIYYLYVRLTICCFAFLPETPTEDQTKYVTVAYLTATRVVTLVSKLLETKNLIELPIYIRQSVTYAALILFKLHLTPLLLDKYIDSARQSIVTVHRLFRNQLSAWKNVENDISRTAQVLEKLNFVLFTHPELYTKTDGIITRMRSHLTGSLFYDLVWCIHEARRRTLEEQKTGVAKPKPTDDVKRPVPLPFYNQINKDDFQTITTTTPGGTTITTLVPTENAMTTATANATAAGLAKPTEIKGIPVAMLDSTGSIPIENPLSSVSSSTDLRKIASKNSNISLAQFQQQAPPATIPATSSTLQQFQQSPVSNLITPASNPTPNFDTNAITHSAQFYDLENINGHPNNNTGLPGTNTPNGNHLEFDINNPPDGLSRSDFDSFFQQQSAGWMEGNDDVLGWFDINMAPEF